MSKDKPTKVEIFKSLEDLANKSPNKTTHQELKQQKLQDQLFKAIQKEDIVKALDQMAKLIKAGAIIDEKILAHPTASSMFEQLNSKAIKGNDLKLIELLVKHKASFNDKPMILAGEQGNLDIIQELLKVENYSGSQNHQQSIASGARMKNHSPVIRYLQYKYPNENFIPEDGFSFYDPVFLKFAINQGNMHINQALRYGISSLYQIVNSIPETNIDPLVQILSTLLGLDAQININNPIEINFFLTLGNHILNSVTTIESIVIGLNMLNVYENLSLNIYEGQPRVLTTDELNNFKQNLREVLEERLQNFDPKLETRNLKKYFKNRCIGDLDDYIHQLNATSSIIQKYKKIHKKDPELSRLLNSFQLSRRELAQNLQKHKMDLLIDHVVFDTRPNTASKLQEKLKLIEKEGQSKGAVFLSHKQSNLFTHTISYLSSKDLGDLGASYLKISDLQQEVKKEKEKIHIEGNKKNFNQVLEEMKGNWSKRVSTPKTPGTIER